VIRPNQPINFAEADFWLASEESLLRDMRYDVESPGQCSSSTDTSEASAGAKSFVQLCGPVENDGHGRGLRLLDWRND